MAIRKFNTDAFAQQIVESARVRVERTAASNDSFDPALLGQFETFDSVGLQSFAVRLGQYAYRRRAYRDELNALIALVVAREGSDDLSVVQRAYLSVARSAAQALSLGNESIVPWCEPWMLKKISRQLSRARSEDDRDIDVSLIRSILEPLLAGDRPAFRSLLGAISGEIVALDAQGIDGRLPDLAERRAYQQLRALQNVLNGVLRASRAGVGSAASRELTVV